MARPTVLDTELPSGTMQDELVRLAASVDDIPTVAQIDAMIIALGGKEKSAANQEMANALLDLRIQVSRQSEQQLS